MDLYNYQLYWFSHILQLRISSLDTTNLVASLFMWHLWATEPCVKFLLLIALIPEYLTLEMNAMVCKTGEFCLIITKLYNQSYRGTYVESEWAIDRFQFIFSSLQFPINNLPFLWPQVILTCRLGTFVHALRAFKGRSLQAYVKLTNFWIPSFSNVFTFHNQFEREWVNTLKRFFLLLKFASRLNQIFQVAILLNTHMYI